MWKLTPFAALQQFLGQSVVVVTIRGRQEGQDSITWLKSTPQELQRSWNFTLQMVSMSNYPYKHQNIISLFVSKT